MDKHLVTMVFFLVGYFLSGMYRAQTDSVPLMKTYRVGIFAPLYLDSIFNEEGKFRYKQGMPKFIMPGVDFINGAQIALDSIRIDSSQVNATIFDTRSYTEPIRSIDQVEKNRQPRPAHRFGKGPRNTNNWLNLPWPKRSPLSLPPIPMMAVLPTIPMLYY
jgi:hypothetical protein